MENNDTNLKLANVIFDLAKNAEESGKYEDAIKSYKEVLNVFEQALGAEDEKTKEVYTNIGMCYKALGKNEEALTYLTKALSNGNTTSVVPKQDTAIAKQETNEAELEEAYKLREKGHESYNKGHESYNKEYYDEALNYYEDALRIFKKVLGNNHEEIGEVNYQIGECYYFLDKYKEAIAPLKKALKIYEKEPEISGRDIICCCHALGDAYNGLEDYNEAIKYYTRALEICDKDTELFGSTIPYHCKGLGCCYHMLDSYGEAIPYYERALEFFEEDIDNSNESFSFCCYGLACCYYLSCDYIKAEYFCSEYLEKANKDHQFRDEAIELLNSIDEELSEEDYNEYKEDNDSKAMGMFDNMVGNASESDIRRIDNKIGGMKKGKLAEIWDKVMKLYQFIKDPNAPWGGKALAIGALIYMISPLDAIPDPIPLAGLLDDVGIITAAVGKLASELRKYK